MSTTQSLRTLLDGPHAAVRDEVRTLLKDPDMGPAIGLGVEEHRARVAQQMQRLASHGIGPSLGFPGHVGGHDDPGGGIAAFETLAFGDLSLLVKVGVQWGLFGGAVMQLGNAEQIERYGPDIVTLALPGCFAMTETGHGSDVEQLRTTATYAPADDEFIVHTPDEDARKDYIGNAARDGRMAVVFAQLIVDDTNHGVHALLVPLRDDEHNLLPGVHITDDGHKAGLNGVDNGRITFDAVRVPRTNLLDRFGTVDPAGTYRSTIESRTRRFFTMLGALVQGRTSVSGAAINACKVALTIAVRYGETRRQFSSPDEVQENRLLDYQAHQRLLLPLLARTYALHFAQEELVRRYVASQDGDDAEARREVESIAAGMKAQATWHCNEVMQACREACGGAGYLSENRLPSLRADTDVFATFEGANTVLMQLVAKGLLTGYSEEFSELDLMGTVRFVADRVLDNVVERLRAVPLLQSLRGAAPVRQTEDLRDRGWHCELFADREEHALETVAARIKAGMDDDGDAFAAFNRAQTHVLYAARVHMENVVLGHLTAAVGKCEDDDVRELLGLVADLYALHTIEADRAWFLEHGRLTPETTKGITQMVDVLCNELRPRALELVEAFGVPEEALMAPIATGAEAARQQLRSVAGPS
ncbi:MAG: acyl-CoA dehydrogenase [Actinomycetota bacterium]